MRLTERQLGGWSLLLGTAVVAVGFVLSPGRGAVDNVSFVNLDDITLAMGRNETLAYVTIVVIIIGALLMLHGLLTLRRFAGPVPRLGLLAMALALVLQMVMRGLDYMITGMGAAALESDAVKSEEWLESALATQRVWFGLHFTSGVAGFTGTAVMALGLAYQPEPVRLPRALNGIVAVLAVASLAVFITDVAFGHAGVGLRARVCGHVRIRARLHGSAGAGAGVITRRPGERRETSAVDLNGSFPARNAEVSAMPQKPSKRPPTATKPPRLVPNADGVVLLSGGNPQIPKGDGDAPVQAYIAAMPEWKRDVGRRLDALIEGRRARRTEGRPVELALLRRRGPGWFISYHCFDKYVKVAFLYGKQLDPMPPVDSKDPDARYYHIFEDANIDETSSRTGCGRRRRYRGGTGFDTV